MIPEFTQKGHLPKGIHRCSGEEFLARFCEVNNFRTGFLKVITDIFDFAKDRNADYIFIGGSFVRDSDKPSDVDVVIVFKKKEYIPSKGERLLIEGQKADIMFCSEDEPKIVDSFVQLFQSGRYGAEDIGIIQVDLNGVGRNWQIRHLPSEDELTIIQRAYCNRKIIDLNSPKGILVTIHGLLTTASWNSEIMPIFSSQGWTVAPFNYGYQTPEILLQSGNRRKVVDLFREWIFELDQRHPGPISVVAHSFGTYIIGAYLAGFEEQLPVDFETIILTGSILNENYDWDTCKGTKVGRVRNEIAPNDQWVKWMPKPKKWLGLDPLFGQSGVKGFTSESSILSQPTNTIFDHNNVIRRDIINQMWLPYIQANRDSLIREYYRELRAPKADSQQHP